MKNLEFKLTCVDEASGAVAEASKRISASLDEVSDSETRVAQTVEDTVAPLSAKKQKGKAFHHTGSLIVW